MSRKIFLLTAVIALLLASCAVNEPVNPKLEQGLETQGITDGNPRRERSRIPNPDYEESENELETDESEDEKADYISELINNMSLEQQISQLFILSLDAKQTAPDEGLEFYVGGTKAGGYVLFTGNITTVEGTRGITDAIREYSDIAPFVCIDEEGGVVSRLYSASLPGYSKKPTARKIGESDGTALAYETAVEIGGTLAAIGVNVNFAPVADVLINPNNTVIEHRAYGADPAAVSDKASAFQQGLHDSGILTAPKHFPGHGASAGDSHFGSVVIDTGDKSLRDAEFLPFKRLIDEGAEFIMTGHLTAPNTKGGYMPATLSDYFLTEVLRGELGFEGIIITDAMNMGAITSRYPPGEAAVMAIKAGVDVILMPEDFSEAFSAVMEAVENGEITKERLHLSLERILNAKLKAGLIELQYHSDAKE